jgi:hypothetical protein
MVSLRVNQSIGPEQVLLAVTHYSDLTVVLITVDHGVNTTVDHGVVGKRVLACQWVARFVKPFHLGPSMANFAALLKSQTLPTPAGNTPLIQ